MNAALRASVCLVLLAAASLRAQIAPTDTLAKPPSAPMVSTGFERNVNTFLWDLRGRYTLGGDAWNLSASERFLRSLIRSDRESVKDENTLEVRASRDLVPSLKLVGRFSSFMFTDSKISGLNDIASHALLGGLEAQPWPFLTLTPLAGYAFDRQQGILDRGFAYHASADLRDMRFGDSELAGQAVFSGASILPRAQQEHHVNAVLATSLTGLNANRLQLQYRTLLRDFYLALDTATAAYAGAARDIETRREDSFGGGDALTYALSDRMDVETSVDLLQRRIGKSRRIRALGPNSQVFDARIDEFRLNGSALARYRTGGGVMQFLVEVNERNESHAVERFAGANAILFSQQEKLEEQKNNAITQTHLALSATQEVSRADTVTVQASTVKIVYDTPSALNVDDRDELFLLAAARWSHRISDRLLAYLSGDVNFRHTVYISSERSANNAWNRVIHLSPGTEYRVGDRFCTRNSADVIANYTVFDFEESNPSQSSYSLRQLILSDSTSWAVHPSLIVTVQLQLRLSERGEFRWTRFTVRPLAWHDERSVNILFTHPARWAQVAVGFRYFELSRYRYSGTERVPENTLRSYGPVCRVWCGTIGRTGVTADGWYQVTSEDPGGTRGTPNISLTAIWNL
jgi:hypothetical protein